MCSQHEPDAGSASCDVEWRRYARGEGKLGNIAVGHSADIIGVDNDPLADVRTLESVSFVMKDGRLYAQ